MTIARSEDINKDDGYIYIKFVKKTLLVSTNTSLQF